MGTTRRTPGEVTVVVTVLNDPRLGRTLESLRTQSRVPARVLIDDGGGQGGTGFSVAEGFHQQDGRFEWLNAPGTIAQSRNQALTEVRTEFVAFLDADEVAPTDWLQNLLAPFDAPAVGFTGGPTPALSGTARGAGVCYYDGYLRRFYDRIARERPSSLPMGNTAWRMAVFDQVGPLDTTLFPRASSEDQEIAVRAQRAGWKGLYVPSASVGHDFSDLTSWGILRKQSRYAMGGFVVWRRTRSTYEATAGRVLPYALLPGVAVLGGILTIWPLTSLVGLVLVGVGLIGLGLLALGLTAQGITLDRQYPGMRFRAFEILRRWATMVGAARGLWRYGLSGRKNLPASSSSPSDSRKP